MALSSREQITATLKPVDSIHTTAMRHWVSGTPRAGLGASSGENFKALRLTKGPVLSIITMAQQLQTASRIDDSSLTTKSLYWTNNCYYWWVSITYVLKNRGFTLPTKVRLVKAMVFPVVTYGCESWTIKQAECQRIDAFKFWCCRRLLWVPWTARRSNQPILKEINPEYTLEGLMLKQKLPYFGHLMRRAYLLKKILMLGKTEGRRRRGWQRMRCLDGITDSMDMSLSNSRRWWRTGKPGVLQSMGWQRVRQDWVTKQGTTATMSISFWASQAALEIKKMPANAGDIRDVGLIPGLERSSGGAYGNPLQYSCLENRMDREAWWAIQSIGSKRVGFDWSDFPRKLCKPLIGPFLLLIR